MEPFALVAACCAAAAAGLLVRPRARGPAPLVGGGVGGTGRTVAGARTARPLRPLVTLGAAALPPVLLGGWAVLVALPLAVLVWRTWGSGTDRAADRGRRRVERDLPQVVDLLAAAVEAGAAPETALVRVADAVPAPVSADLHRVASGLRLGMEPARVWRELAGRAGYGPLGRSMVRTAETGAPVVAALEQLAVELRAVRRTRAEARARAVGVRAAAPLGVCLLPAFVLVGIVPLVVGLSGLVVGP